MTRRDFHVYERLSVPGAAATNHRRSANLDVVRAIAALSVLVAHSFALSVRGSAHAPAWAGDLVGLLSNGVWLFFALSGYLIAGPFMRALVEGRPLPAARSYAVRRASRILPAYWLALAVVLIVATGVDLRHWWQLPVHGLLIQDFFLGEPNRMLFVAWTLSVEAMFYAFVPLAAWLAWRVAGRRAIPVPTLAKGIIVIWIASMAWRIGLSFIVTPQALANGSAPPLLEILRWLLPSFLGCFAPGALIFLAETRQAAGLSGAWSVYRGLRSRPLPTATAALAVALLLTILTQRGGRWFEIGSTLLAVPAGLGILAVMSEGPRRAMLGRILAPIGLISYGIYLWHAVIRDAIERHAINQLPGAGAGAHAWPFHAGLLVALTVPVALASWLLLERPLLRATTNWDRTRVERRKTSAEAPAAVAG